MAKDSDFITDAQTGMGPHDYNLQMSFGLKVVAGDKDQFVPPESSLGPFPRHLQFVVPGDHLSMIRAADTDSPS